MAVQSTTGSASGQLRSYFNRQLLDYAVPMFKWSEDALRAPLPKNQGSNRNVTWFRWDVPATGAIATLANTAASAEGTALSVTAGRALTLSTVTATLQQYGEIVTVTDLMSAQELFDSVQQGIQVMGQDCALHLDWLTRAAVINSGVAANNVFMGTAVTAVSQVSGAAQTGAYLSTLDLLEAATNLKKANAPRFADGYYHAVICPESSYDLQTATGSGDWLDINKYVNNTPLLDGEVGRAYGVRVKESTIPLFTATTAAPYTYSTAGTLVVNAVYGRGAYGVTDMASQSPFGPQVIMTNGPDKSDPLNQITTVGWKTFFAATSLHSTGAIFTSLLIGTASLDS